MHNIYSNKLNRVIDWSDQEYSNRKKYLDWEELTLVWEDVDLTWDEVFLVLELISRRGGGSQRGEYEKSNPWKQTVKDLGDEKTKKIIKLYCKVRGVDYDLIKEPIDDVKVTVNEFNRFINEVSIKVDI